MIIDGTDLSMTRGDDETITITMFNEDETQRAFVTGDKIYFTVKENAIDVSKVIQEIITAKTFSLIFSNDRSAMPGRSEYSG